MQVSVELEAAQVDQPVRAVLVLVGPPHPVAPETAAAAPRVASRERRDEAAIVNMSVIIIRFGVAARRVGVRTRAPGLTIPRFPREVWLIDYRAIQRPHALVASQRQPAAHCFSTPTTRSSSGADLQAADCPIRRWLRNNVFNGRRMLRGGAWFWRPRVELP